MPNFHLINICVFYRYYNFFLICHDISFPFRTILGGRKIAITIVRNNNTGFFFFLGLHKVLHPNLERDNRVFTTL
ncbi:ANL_collapsed_G0037360.mRNA.1.CDS.1 [Saccharomyces cerevisiae]|nr:BAK_1a_G0036460.mRNA.1.CDS.1 [Saccharomyces cerevisiae]CAI4622588.1 BDF_1d_G0036970.mRNA.1.CDS.1 [Saccharomyces cerevisiae]CAI4632455.1 BAI_1a_G0036480.mRNA.1.CDS.1 [Saccharomyces cerevisiae]CAI4636206.1 ALH_1c_G0037000.mRNA.1.CDS.1 [Saccharomyces cerevisiae]CAI4639567.1 CDG_1a_G0036990.mRNA.1.CDS.1 [Saccharomyces cerevisiae]